MSTRGRPTLYKPELCALALKHSRLGASNNQLAALFGVSPRSIDNWIARIPEFAAAVTEGRAEVLAEKARQLFKRAVGYSSIVERVVRCPGGGTQTVTFTRHHLPETRACIRYLCIRRPQNWRRRPDLPPGAPQNRVAPAAQEFGSSQLSGNEDGLVADSLHQRTVGCRQTVERVFVRNGKPVIVTYIRHHLPQFEASTFWLCNRRPRDWRPVTATRSISPAAHQLEAEPWPISQAHPPMEPPAVCSTRAGGTDPAIGPTACTQVAAGGALNESEFAKVERAANSAIVLPFKPSVRADGPTAGRLPNRTVGLRDSRSASTATWDRRAPAISSPGGRCASLARAPPSGSRTLQNKQIDASLAS